MKKVSFQRLLPLCIGFLALCSCDKEKDISYNSLPEESRTFIATYYENASVTKVEKKNREPRYTVELNNGFTLHFYGEGACQCVDGNGSAISQGVVYALLPGNITMYVVEYYPQATITFISIEDYGYYLELGTQPGVSLKFDREGGVITIVEKDYRCSYVTNE